MSRRRGWGGVGGWDIGCLAHSYETAGRFPFFRV